MNFGSLLSSSEAKAHALEKLPSGRLDDSSRVLPARCSSQFGIHSSNMPCYTTRVFGHGHGSLPIIDVWKTIDCLFWYQRVHFWTRHSGMSRSRSRAPSIMLTASVEDTREEVLLAKEYKYELVELRYSLTFPLYLVGSLPLSSSLLFQAGFWLRSLPPSSKHKSRCLGSQLRVYAHI